MGVRPTDQLAGSPSSHPADAPHLSLGVEAKAWRELYLSAAKRAALERRRYLELNNINFALIEALLAIAEGDILPDEMQAFAKDTITRAEIDRSLVVSGKFSSQIEEAERSEADEVDATSKSAGLTQKTQDIPS